MEIEKSILEPFSVSHPLSITKLGVRAHLLTIWETNTVLGTTFVPSRSPIKDVLVTLSCEGVY